MVDSLTLTLEVKVVGLDRFLTYHVLRVFAPLDQTMNVAGMISGTSADGIDVALVEISGRGWSSALRVKKFATVRYPRRVRQAILEASNAASISVAEISQLNFQVGELFAAALLKVCGRRKPDLIGSHGQTIFHQGRPIRSRIASTVQIGEPAVIAARTSVTTVGDFRVADMAAGGEGAPLVPFLDYLLCRHARRSRVALNIGGIANITVIPASAGLERVTAFDTGPGNMVIDALVERFTGGRRKYDRGGAWAARGSVNEGELKQLMCDPYYRRRPPKTAGREQYGREFVDSLLKLGLAEEDLLATSAALTADTIAQAILRSGGVPDDLLVSGGGAHNRFLMRRLSAALPDTRFLRAEDFGIPGDAKEGVLFAVLAYETFHRRPGNIPSATGARRPVVLGKICSGR
jgi:anhydro-N-acetylmuramic acid kinase